MKTTTQNAPHVIFTVKPEDIRPALTDRQINNRMKKIADLDAEIKRLQAERDALADEVKAAITDTFESDLFKVTYKEVTSRRFDSTAFKKDHADLYEAYRKPSTTRPFKYTVKGGN